MNLGDPETLDFAEAARLVNVWSRLGYAKVSWPTLAYRAARTATFTPRVPRAQDGLGVLLSLQLATIAVDGLVRADEVLARFPEEGPTVDRLSPGLRDLCFDRLLEHREHALRLAEALRHARLGPDGAWILWRGVPVDERRNPAWIWLQQLELAEFRGSILRLNRRLRPFAAGLPTGRTIISQAELEERLVEQRLRASLAEDLIVELERTRLRDSGAPDLAEAVRRVSLYDALAGYDIASYELTGAPRYVEVKSSAGPRERFHFSRGERETAEQLGDAYWIAWVGWSSRLPAGKCDVAWFRSPAALWREGGPWRLDFEDAVVCRVGSDEEFATTPTQN